MAVVAAAADNYVVNATLNRRLMQTDMPGDAMNATSVLNEESACTNVNMDTSSIGDINHLSRVCQHTYIIYIYIYVDSLVPHFYKYIYTHTSLLPHLLFLFAYVYICTFI